MSAQRCCCDCGLGKPVLDTWTQYRGFWENGASYAVGDLILIAPTNDYYVCTVAHTADIATNLPPNASYWATRERQPACIYYEITSDIGFAEGRPLYNPADWDGGYPSTRIRLYRKTGDSALLNDKHILRQYTFPRGHEELTDGANVYSDYVGTDCHWMRKCNANGDIAEFKLYFAGPLGPTSRYIDSIHTDFLAQAIIKSATEIEFVIWGHLSYATSDNLYNEWLSDHGFNTTFHDPTDPDTDNPCYITPDLPHCDSCDVFHAHLRVEVFRGTGTIPANWIDADGSPTADITISNDYSCSQIGDAIIEYPEMPGLNIYIAGGGGTVVLKSPPATIPLEGVGHVSGTCSAVPAPTDAECAGQGDPPLPPRPRCPVGFYFDGFRCRRRKTDDDPRCPPGYVWTGRRCEKDRKDDPPPPPPKNCWRPWVNCGGSQKTGTYTDCNTRQGDVYRKSDGSGDCVYAGASVVQENPPGSIEFLADGPYESCNSCEGPKWVVEKCSGDASNITSPYYTWENLEAFEDRILEIAWTELDGDLDPPACVTVAQYNGDEDLHWLIYSNDFESCDECVPQCYTLTSCQNGETIETDSDLSAYEGQVISYDGDCWTVSTGHACPGGSLESVSASPVSGCDDAACPGPCDNCWRDGGVDIEQNTMSISGSCGGCSGSGTAEFLQTSTAGACTWFWLSGDLSGEFWFVQVTYNEGSDTYYLSAEWNSGADEYIVWDEDLLDGFKCNKTTGKLEGTVSVASNGGKCGGVVMACGNGTFTL